MPAFIAMTKIAMRCQTAAAAWICDVSLESPDGSRSTHEVRVSRGDLARFAPGAHDPTDLVRRSFEFLLAREPKESILPRFDLPVIGRYFPEYEASIRND